MLGIAVVGCGYWGPNHVRTFHQLPDCRVTAVDSDPARLARLAESFPQVQVERSYDRILQDPEIDAVVIATPTQTHFSLVRSALLAGKHVLCEKPLCVETAGARQLALLAAERRLALMVGHIFLFNPGIELLRDLVQSGDLGDIRYFSAARTNLGPVRSDVNVAYDLAAHDIAIFNWLLDSVPDDVAGQGEAWLQHGIHDAAFIQLKYPGGALAQIHASWLNPVKVRQITVVGSQRMATWDDLKPAEPVTVFDRGAIAAPAAPQSGERIRIETWDLGSSTPQLPKAEPLRLQNQAFVEAIRTGDVARSDGAFSVGVVQTLEAVSESLLAGGRPICLREAAVAA